MVLPNVAFFPYSRKVGKVIAWLGLWLAGGSYLNTAAARENNG